MNILFATGVLPNYRRPDQRANQSPKIPLFNSSFIRWRSASFSVTEDFKFILYECRVYFVVSWTQCTKPKNSLRPSDSRSCRVLLEPLKWQRMEVFLAQISNFLLATWLLLTSTEDNVRVDALIFQRDGYSIRFKLAQCWDQKQIFGTVGWYLRHSHQ